MIATIRQYQQPLALFFLTIFLSVFFPPKYVKANSNAPQAPEATAFEPVDAADMVNLLTGNPSYTIPILNVPSPEGGYPIALSYHGPIAMDQEASWVGLGWTLSPGQINRNVNGVPDDWRMANYSEYFWDKGGKETYTSISLGVSGFGEGTGLSSVGLSLSWGSNTSFGGSVSLGFLSPLDNNLGFGFSPSFGTNGASIGLRLDLDPSNNFISQLGLSVGTDGIEANAALSNGLGFSGNSSKSFGISLQSAKRNSVGINFSSRGLSVRGSTSGMGTGFHIAFNKSISSSDYNINRSGIFIPIMFPLGGNLMANASYSHQKIKWFLDRTYNHKINGPLYYRNANSANFGDGRFCSIDSEEIDCTDNQGQDIYTEYSTANIPGVAGDVIVDYISPSRIANILKYAIKYPNINMSVPTYCGSNKNIITDIYYIPASFFPITTDVRNNNMDVYELATTSEELNNHKANTSLFPAYDNYQISSQGLSGTIQPILAENNTLLGYSRNIEEGSDEYTISYLRASQKENNAFNQRVQFIFKNEISSFLSSKESIIKTDPQASVFDYLTTSTNYIAPRKKDGRYIKYFTNQEIVDANESNIIKPVLSTNQKENGKRDLNQFPADGIGAYQITTPDGKTYHYSLPVYNFERINREIGKIKGKDESESYFEKLQLEPYATHWLLTAITGSDYIDYNNNNYVDEDDFGYWVEFEYGKWSDGSFWRSPTDKLYETSEEDNTKHFQAGRKQLYYLDKIKTRTHSAIFIKDWRTDGVGAERFSFDLPAHVVGKGQNVEYPKVPIQVPLKLNKIILINNKDADIIKKSQTNNDFSNSIQSNKSNLQSFHFKQPYAQFKWRKDSDFFNFDLNIEQNILDVNDIAYTNIEEKALKVIDFHYAPSSQQLGKGLITAGDYGRLTLLGIDLKGKEGKKVTPGFNFQYYYPEIAFDPEKVDEWGYHIQKPEIWSLRQIDLPMGGKINLEYESDSSKSLVNRDEEFTLLSHSIENNKLKAILRIPENYTVNTLGKVNVDFQKSDLDGCDCKDEDMGYDRNCDVYYTVTEYSGKGTITKINSIDNSFEIISDNPIVTRESMDENDLTCPSYNEYINSRKFYSLEDGTIHPGGGIRVSKVILNDGMGSVYTTEYNYNNPSTNTSSGITSFTPYHDRTKKLPYAPELPGPNVYYEFVSVSQKGNAGHSLGKTLYKFQVMKTFDDLNIKFGEDFTITNNEYQSIDSKNKLINIKQTRITDNLATIGRPLEITIFNETGLIVGKTVNNYSSKEEINQYNSMNGQIGPITESYNNIKAVYKKGDRNKDEYNIVASTREIYPSILKSTSIIKGNYITTTYFDEYDPQTGQLLKTRTYTSDGNEMFTKTTPAYKIYPEMGNKALNENNRHMLTQIAENKAYLLDLNGNKKILSNTIQTWSKEWKYRTFSGIYNDQLETTEKNKVWRKHRNYIWQGELNEDGSYKTGSGTYQFSYFDWNKEKANQPQNKAGWIKNSEITRYDRFSMPLEIRDINNDPLSTKLDINSHHVLATSNTAYTNFFYNGFETSKKGYEIGAEMIYNSSNYDRNTTNSHTGRYSLKIPHDQVRYLINTTVSNKIEHMKPGNYKVSFWTIGSPNLILQNNYATTILDHEQKNAGEWTLHNYYFNIKSGGLKLGFKGKNGCLIDDFRIHPIESSVTSYVYDELSDELISIIDGNSLATKYIYDSAGRLIEIHQEVFDQNGLPGGFKQIKRYNYNIKH